MELPRLWVRSQPFDFALVQSPPSQRLTFQSLRRLCLAVRSKSRSGQADWLSYALWKSFATTKLQCSEEIAWAFFESYQVLCAASTADRLDWCRQFSTCVTEEDHELARRRAKVFLPRFLLFLVLQLSSQISLRSLSAQDVAVGSRGPPLQSATAKITEEHSHLQFFSSQLSQMLSLLADPDSLLGSPTGGISDQAIPLASVRAFSFLLVGTHDGQTVASLDEIAQAQSQLAESGYSKLTRSFAISKLSAWILKHLVADPFGVDACIAKRRHALSAPKHPVSPHVIPLAVGKTATNQSYAPEGHGLVLFSQVNAQTIVRVSADIGSCGVVIKRSNHCTFYLLAPLRFVRVERCRDITLVLGCVRDVVKLHHCQDMKVYTVTRRLHVSDCSDCTLYACTPTRPLFLYGVNDITLAPYNTHYPRLEDDMRTCGVPTEPNYWNKPLCSSLADGQSSRSCYKMMDPMRFFLYAIPFTMPGTTTSCPTKLPLQYTASLAKHESDITNLRVKIKAILGTEGKEKMKEFAEASKELFKEWLRDNGYQRELDDLVDLQRATARTS